MKKSDIEKVIDEQAEDRRANLGMERDALPSIPVEPKFATIVTGVRRCGKSTMLNQWIEACGRPSVAIHFDDLRLETFDTSDFLLLDDIVRERKAEVLVLDEPQDIDGWERYVNGNLDKRRKVLVTGSNAKMLSRELGTKLTGRHLDAWLTPFTFAEFCRFENQEPSAESVDDYLMRGGFPVYVESGRREILQELFNDIIYRDIVVRYRLRDASSVRMLTTYLLSHVGCRIAPSRLKGAIGVSSPATVLEYFDFLEETYLIKRIPRFCDSPKARMGAPKKVYACDTGLVSVMETKDAVNFGHKLENLVFNRLATRNEPLSYYVNDEDETECDFLVEQRDGGFEAIQVAYDLNSDNEEREIAGAVHAMERFGLKESLLVTRDRSDLINQGGKLIRVVPSSEFLA